MLLAWQVRDGKSVKVWEDKWVPELHRYILATIPPNFDNSVSYVTDLIDPVSKA